MDEDHALGRHAQPHDVRSLGGGAHPDLVHRRHGGDIAARGGPRVAQLRHAHGGDDVRIEVRGGAPLDVRVHREVPLRWCRCIDGGDRHARVPALDHDVHSGVRESGVNGARGGGVTAVTDQHAPERNPHRVPIPAGVAASIRSRSASTGTVRSQVAGRTMRAAAVLSARRVSASHASARRMAPSS